MQLTYYDNEEQIDLTKSYNEQSNFNKRVIMEICIHYNMISLLFKLMADEITLIEWAEKINHLP